MSKTTGQSAQSRAMRHPQGLVLILDSDRQIRALVSEWLEMAGYRCVQASATGAMPEATAQCDIALVDVRLPPRSARESVASVQAAAPRAAIIVTSADALAVGSSALQAVERELGVAAVLVKPFDRNALMQALERTGNAI